MKILHIVAGGLNSGAARGAYWLHEGLVSQNIHSIVLTQFPTDLDNTVAILFPARLKRLQLKVEHKLENNKLAKYEKKKDTIFSTGLIGNDITSLLAYKEADIIHLHWINNDMLSIKDIGKIDKPIVWTLRDMWPMTGGCHYAMDCTNFETGCGNCEQLGSFKKSDLSKTILNQKINSYPKHIKLVGISHWISEQAKKSTLFKNYDIRTINNNIDTEKFQLIDKVTAKEALGINTNKKIILVGSTQLKDFYKGFDKFLEVLQLLDQEKYFICFFGVLSEEVKRQLEFEYKSFGFLKDTVSLQILYAASDVFVAPSIMEAFGKTIAESMACGTPVVCFNSTGPKDIVDHKINGYLAKPFDAEDLKNGIEWVLNTENYDDLCQNARKKVLEKFDSKVVAKQYIELYKEVLHG